MSKRSPFGGDPDDWSVARLKVRVAELEEALGRVAEWTHAYGSELVPAGVDTYGEGVRDCKARVARIIGEMPPPSLSVSTERKEVPHVSCRECASVGLPAHNLIDTTRTCPAYARYRDNGLRPSDAAAVVHDDDGKGRPSCGAATNRGDSVARAGITCRDCLGTRTNEAKADARKAWDACTHYPNSEGARKRCPCWEWSDECECPVEGHTPGCPHGFLTRVANQIRMSVANEIRMNAQRASEVKADQSRLDETWRALTDAAEHYSSWEETGLDLEAATADLHSAALAYADAHKTEHGSHKLARGCEP